MDRLLYQRIAWNLSRWLVRPGELLAVDSQGAWIGLRRSTVQEPDVVLAGIEVVA